jgi:SAM-dependent methyltransferase
VSLYDLLACPVCRGDLATRRDALRCQRCERDYPVVNGVPILLPNAEQPGVAHEAELGLRQGYDPWLHRMVLQSLTDAQVVVDVGCGNMALDDPCIIRMDASLTPYVDVVGDVHSFPFRSGTIDFVMALAVVEHLRQPFEAAAAIWEALKPGGYVYAESNFVFAYHGYPHHYFNASVHGLAEVFARFHRIRLGEAPYQMPSFALESVLGTYLATFRPGRPEQERFADLVRLVLQYPLRHYDAAIDPASAFKTAAGCYFLGTKQTVPTDTTIPRPILDVYERRPELQARYPDANDLSTPQNLMIWAQTEGRALHSEIADYFATLKGFVKWPDASRVPDRSFVRSLPLIPDPAVARLIEEPNHREMEGTGEARLRELAAATHAGPAGPAPRPQAARPGRVGRAVRRLQQIADETRFRLRFRHSRQAPPLPPGHLVYLVSGTDNMVWFAESGAMAARGIRAALARAGVDIMRLGAVLDFGCGAGRIMRNWVDLRRPALYGTDQNPELVRWCRENIGFARFAVNEPEGRLDFDDASFDLVYAFSVFTHLTEEQHAHWMRELVRVLRPGGYLYLTTHGEYYKQYLPADRQEQFRLGDLVVCGGDHAGSNLCAAFHPEIYVRMVLGKGLAVVDYAPGEFPQDAYLFQIPG